MGFIVILPIAALAGWAIFTLFRWLGRARCGPQWRQRFLLFAVAGLALGIWWSFFLKYRVANVKLEGFPIPLVITTQEKPEAPWVVSHLPPAVRIGGIITDILCGVALALAPVATAAYLNENRLKNSAGPDKAPA